MKVVRHPLCLCDSVHIVEATTGQHELRQVCMYLEERDER
jgi:hypothetical protein